MFHGAVRHPELLDHFRDKSQIDNPVGSPAGSLIEQFRYPVLQIGHHFLFRGLGVTVKASLEVVKISKKPCVGILIQRKTPASNTDIHNFFHLNYLIFIILFCGLNFFVRPRPCFAIIFTMQRYK